MKYINDANVDFIYIDGDHRYEAVRDDIQIALKLTKDNFYIGGHDYYERWPGVVRAVDQIFQKKSLMVFPDTSWLIKKKAKHLNK